MTLTQQIEALNNRIDAIHNSYPDDSTGYAAIQTLHNLLFKIINRPKQRPATVQAVRDHLAAYSSDTQLSQDLRHVALLFGDMVGLIELEQRQEF